MGEPLVGFEHETDVVWFRIFKDRSCGPVSFGHGWVVQHQHPPKGSPTTGWPGVLDGALVSGLCPHRCAGAGLGLVVERGEAGSCPETAEKEAARPRGGRALECPGSWAMSPS